MIEVGTRKFQFKKDIAALARSMLRGSPLDQDFLRGLIERHPHRAEKIGCGIARFEVAPNGVGDCFWIIRTDGSRVDFSYKVCITPPTPYSSVRAALRNEIIYQVSLFKYQHLGERCPYSGEIVTAENAHVDHAEPEFADIARAWLADHPNPAIEDDHALAGSREKLATESDRDSWREFHQQRARLVLCTQAGHRCRHSKQPSTISTPTSP